LKRRVLVHKGEQHKFGETVRFALDFSHERYVLSLLARRLNMTVHHSRCARQTQTMAEFNRRLPLARANFSRTNYIPHSIGENFCRCSGHRVQSSRQQSFNNFF
jgi:hypothetical protein